MSKTIEEVTRWSLARRTSVLVWDFRVDKENRLTKSCDTKPRVASQSTNPETSQPLGVFSTLGSNKGPSFREVRQHDGSFHGKSS
jgi:hypothetical protein